MSSAKDLRRLVSERLLHNLAAHDRSGDEAKAIVLNGARNGIVDLTCQRVTSEVVTFLQGVATSEHPMTELNLQCASIDADARAMLLELVAKTPSLETCYDEGCSGVSVEWRESMAALCRQNRERNAEMLRERERAEAQARFDAAERHFHEHAPLVVRAHYNGFLAIEAEEAKEWRMLLRASKFIAAIAEEEERKVSNLNSLLDRTRDILSAQAQRRTAIFNLQIRDKLGVLEAMELAERHLRFVRVEHSQRSAMWRQCCDSFEVQRQKLSCRFARERVARAEVELAMMQARTVLGDEEREAFAELVESCDAGIGAIVQRQRDMRLRVEEEKRRARQKADEDARTRAHRLERQRFEAAQSQALFLANRSKMLANEEAVRNRITTVERALYVQLCDAFIEVDKVNRAGVKFQRALEAVAVAMAVSARCVVSSNVSASNPLFVYEQSNTWTTIDPKLSVELTMPSGWAQRVERLREEARAAAISLRTLRLSRQKRLRAIWDAIAEAAIRHGLALSFIAPISDSSSTVAATAAAADPLEQSLPSGGSSPTIQPDAAGVAAATTTTTSRNAAKVAALFPTIFSAADETELVVFDPLEAVIAEKLRVRAGRLSVALLDEHRVLLASDDATETLRLSSAWPIAPRWAPNAASFEAEIPEEAPDDAATGRQPTMAAVTAGLQGIEFFTKAKNFGPVKQMLLSIEGKLGNAIRISAALPICICQHLIGTHVKTWSVDGTAELSLGAPWVVRDIPVVRSSAGGGDANCSDSSTATSAFDADSLHIFPELVFDARSAREQQIQHLGFAGASIEISLSGAGCTPDDRVFISTKMTKSLKLILGVISVDGVMVAKVEEGSLLPQIGAPRHVIRFVSHTEVKREVVASILNSLRFCCTAKNPVVGVREVTIRVSPPDRAGPFVVIPIDVKAVDVPTQLDLVDRKAIFRSRCPVDTPPGILDFATALAISSAPIAPKAEIIDPDTEYFSGGYLRVTITSGGKPGDHLWIRNSDGRGTSPMETLRPGIHLRPTVGAIGAADVWYFDTKIGELSVVAGAYGSCVGAAGGGESGSTPGSPTELAETYCENDTTDEHGQTLVGVELPGAADTVSSASLADTTRSDGAGSGVPQAGAAPSFRKMKPSASKTSLDATASTLSRVSKSFRTGSKKGTQQSSLSQSPQSVVDHPTENAYQLYVKFESATPVPLAGAQELLRSVCFTSTRTHPVAGRRDVAVELLVGQTQQRTDVSGHAITLDSKNDVLRDTTSVRVTASVVRVASRTSELTYLEGSGAKRITALETLSDEESQLRLWLGYIRFDIDDPTLFDALSLRALEDSEFFDSTVGKIVVAPSIKAADKLRGELARVDRRLLPPQAAAGPESLLQRSPPIAPVAGAAQVSPREGSPPRSPERVPEDSDRAVSPIRELSSSSRSTSPPISETASRRGSAALGGTATSQLAGVAPPVIATRLPSFTSVRLPYAERASEPVLYATRIEAAAMHQGAASLASRGITQRFFDCVSVSVEQLTAFELVRGGAVIAVAYAVPGCVVISWANFLKRRDLSYLLRALTYECSDKHPNNLQRIGRVTVFDGFCESCAVFPIQIVPVDDPLEITVAQPVVRYRTNASELDHFSSHSVRETLNAHRVAAQATPLEEEPRSMLGSIVPLFKAGTVTLSDPDTPFWDRGAVLIDPVSGGVRGESIQLLSVEQQIACMGVSPFVITTTTATAAAAATPTSSDAATTESSNAMAGAAVMHLCSYDAESGAVAVIEQAIATLSWSAKGQNAAALTITFRANGTRPNVPINGVIDINILTYIVNCVCYSFGANSAAPNCVTRTIRLTISDGRNPTPGKAQVSLEVLPPILATKERTYTIPISSTRTKQAADAYPILQKLILAIGGDKDVLTRGYIEVFVANGVCPGDNFQLRINGSAFAVGAKDGVLSAAKEVIGKLTQLPAPDGSGCITYLRIDFLPTSKASNTRRLMELLKMLYFQYSERGEREVWVVYGDVAPLLVEHSVLKVLMSVM